MPSRSVAWCLYALATVLIVHPPVGVVAQAWPLNPGATQWRFAFAGLLSSTLIMPAIGLALLFWAAQALSHRKVQILFTAASGLLALTVLVIIPLFILDALQLRGEIVEAGRSIFDSSTLTVLICYGLLLVVFSTYAIQGMRAVRQSRRERSTATPLVGVGRT